MLHLPEFPYFPFWKKKSLYPCTTVEIMIIGSSSVAGGSRYSSTIWPPGSNGVANPPPGRWFADVYASEMWLWSAVYMCSVAPSGRWNRPNCRFMEQAESERSPSRQSLPPSGRFSHRPELSVLSCTGISTPKVYSPLLSASASIVRAASMSTAGITSVGTMGDTVWVKL